eukprot:3954791-Amphidinium_carterae.2
MFAVTWQCHAAQPLELGTHLDGQASQPLRSGGVPHGCGESADCQHIARIYCCCGELALNGAGLHPTSSNARYLLSIGRACDNQQCSALACCMGQWICNYTGHSLSKRLLPSDCIHARARMQAAAFKQAYRYTPPSLFTEFGSVIKFAVCPSDADSYKLLRTEAARHPPESSGREEENVSEAAPG